MSDAAVHLERHLGELLLRELVGGDRLAEDDRAPSRSRAPSRGRRAPQPTTPNTMPKRASFRHDSGPRSAVDLGEPRSPRARARRSSTSSDVTDARSESLWCMSRRLEPGRALLDEEAVDLAVLGARPHDRDVGDRAVRDPHLRAVEDPVVAVAARRASASPPGSEPASGSVSPKQPIASPAAIAGSQRCFCSSEPKRRIANIASDPWTETSERIPASPASSSMAGEAVASTELAPGSSRSPRGACRGGRAAASSRDQLAAGSRPSRTTRRRAA